MTDQNIQIPLYFQSLPLIFLNIHYFIWDWKICRAITDVWSKIGNSPLIFHSYSNFPLLKTKNHEISNLIISKWMKGSLFILWNIQAIFLSQLFTGKHFWEKSSDSTTNHAECIPNPIYTQTENSYRKIITFNLQLLAGKNYSAKLSASSSAFSVVSDASSKSGIWATSSVLPEDSPPINKSKWTRKCVLYSILNIYFQPIFSHLE